MSIIPNNLEEDRQVLPTNVAPKHYDLLIEPDLENFTYKGQVSIE
jgi:aminopeptidase 2